ncbi:MAG TPA: carbohydrate binding domain-containing protein [Chthonomonadales bacterium]|nr:carbohydrate binding domain-containing protein [Chthonomonadales bacterium]
MTVRARVRFSAALCLFAFAALASAGGQGLPRLEVSLDAGLRGKRLLYWLTGPSGRSTEPRELAAPATGAAAVDVPPGFGPGSRLKLLDPATGLLARVPFDDDDLPNPAGMTGPNLLENTDFQGGLDGWLLERGHPSVVAEASIVADEALRPPGVRGNVLRAEITSLGPLPWHIQFYQQGLTLRANVVYTVSFWARASEPRTVDVAMNTDTGDGHGIGLDAKGIALTREWRRFRLPFTASQPVENHGRLVFVLGESTGVVELAGVRLRTGMPARPAGPNLFRNPNFIAGDQHWSLVRGATPARGTLDVAPSGGPTGVPGGVASISVEAIGDLAWHVHLVQHGVALENLVPYVIEFWARASEPRDLEVDAAVGGDGDRHIGLRGVLPLTTTWRRQQVVFTPSRVSPDRNRIAFLVGQAVGRVDFAGMSLRRAGEAAGADAAPAQVAVTAADFRHVSGPALRVTHRGRPVHGVRATVHTPGAEGGQGEVRTVQHGVVTLGELPLDTRVTITLSHNNREHSVLRTAERRSPRTLAPVVLRDELGEVPTTAPAQEPTHPIIGAWEGRLRDGPIVRMTFNADGTGSAGAPTAAPAGAPVAPAPNPFRWFLRPGGRTVVIANQSYTWAIGADGATLTLTDARGRGRVLRRR